MRYIFLFFAFAIFTSLSAQDKGTTQLAPKQVVATASSYPCCAVTIGIPGDGITTYADATKVNWTDAWATPPASSMNVNVLDANGVKASGWSIVTSKGCAIDATKLLRGVKYTVVLTSNGQVAKRDYVW